MTRANWSKFNGFFSSAIWRLDGDDLPKSRAIWLKPARILLLTIHGFIKDRCTLRASALTFYSLLSVVPVVAMAFGISKGFGLEQRLEKQLYLRFAGQKRSFPELSISPVPCWRIPKAVLLQYWRSAALLVGHQSTGAH
jgi:membrane protein